MKGNRWPSNPLHRFAHNISVTPSCWTWNGKLNKGYGQIYLFGRLHYAHRFSYELHRGAIPEGLTIDHLCRNRSCVNPWHLEAVTLKENILRGESAPAKCARRSTCMRGHKMIQNYRKGTPDLKRLCLVCERMRLLKYAEKIRSREIA